MNAAQGVELGDYMGESHGEWFERVYKTRPAVEYLQLAFGEGVQFDDDQAYKPLQSIKAAQYLVRGDVEILQADMGGIYCRHNQMLLKFEAVNDDGQDIIAYAHEYEVGVVDRLPVIDTEASFEEWLDLFDEMRAQRTVFVAS